MSSAWRDRGNHTITISQNMYAMNSKHSGTKLQFTYIEVLNLMYEQYVLSSAAV
jgi:hypothetical protein